MNLIIDVGNTFVKLAVFKNSNLLLNESTEVENLINRTKLIFHEFPQIDWAIVSSVVDLGKSEMKALTDFCNVHILNHQSKIPFKNLYASPTTLGVDRIALAAAAFYNSTNITTLVIDAGTCITY
ncbi:MAG: type III pantothenate kinase, partial [Maribacter sp.]|nr:type III pantothenate kinase [Maribacter sp.]